MNNKSNELRLWITEVALGVVIGIIFGSALVCNIDKIINY